MSGFDQDNKNLVTGGQLHKVASAIVKRVKDYDDILDGKISDVADDVKQLQTDLESEVTRATKAEGVLTQALADEKDESKDGSLAKKIADEVDRAKKAEGNLQTAINNEVQDRKDAVSVVAQRVATLEGKFEGEQSVDSKIAAAQQAAIAEAGRLDSLLKTELEGYADQAEADAIAAAKTETQTQVSGAKTELESKINTVANNLAAAEEELGGRLDTIEGEDEGSIKKAKADAIASAKSYTDQQIETVNTAAGNLEKRVKDNEDAIGVITGTGEGSIKKAVADLVSAAPENMNTLKELSDAIAAHQSVYEGYINTVNGQIATAKQEAITAAGTAADGKITAARVLISKEIDDDVKEVADELTKQKDAAQSGTLANQIKVEKEAREAADNVLDGRIDALEAIDHEAYKAADEQVLADAEADATQKANTAKSEAIAAAEAKDEALHTAITGEIATAKSDAIAAAEAKDEALHTAITKEIATAKSDAENTAKGYTDQEIGKVKDESTKGSLAYRIKALEGLMGEGSVSDQIKAVQDALDEFEAAQKTKDNEQDEAIQAAKAQADKGVEDAAKALTDAKAHAASLDATLKAELQKEIEDEVKVVSDELAKQKDAAQKGTLANQIAQEVSRAKGEEARIEGKVDGAVQSIGTLQTQVVNTFKGLKLDFSAAGTAEIVLVSAGEGGQVTSNPLGGKVDLPVMAPSEVDSLIESLDLGING